MSKKYSTNIFSDVSNSVWLDLRSSQIASVDPIPNATQLHLYSTTELKKLQKYGFASEIGKDIMERVYRCSEMMDNSKKILLIDQGKKLVAQAFWQHYQVTHSVSIYKGGMPALLQESKKVYKENYNFVVLHGKTGSGKTELLEKLEENGQQVLNLEKIARHKGSGFGNLTSQNQPSQNYFELHLALTLAKFDTKKVIFTEYERGSLGKNIFPLGITDLLEKSSAVKLQVSKEQRIQRIVREYAGVNDRKIQEELTKLSARLGREKAEHFILQLFKKNYAAVSEGLLDYFDKADGYASRSEKTYVHSLSNENLEKAAEELILKFGQKKTSPCRRRHCSLDRHLHCSSRCYILASISWFPLFACRF